MLRPREQADEPPEHQLATVLRISQRQVWNGRLFPNDKLNLRDEANEELPIRLERLLQGTTPPVYFGFTLDEDLTDQRPQGLCQGRVRDVALVLIELA